MGRELEQEEDKVLEDFKRDFGMPISKNVVKQGAKTTVGAAKHVVGGAYNVAHYVPRAIHEGAGAIECLKIIWSGRKALLKYENRIDNGGHLNYDGTVIGKDRLFSGNEVSLNALRYFDKNPQNVKIDDVFSDELRKQFNESGIAYNARVVSDPVMTDDMIPEQEQDIDPETGEKLFDYEWENEYDELGNPVMETVTNRFGEEYTQPKKHHKQQPVIDEFGKPVMKNVLDDNGNIVMETKKQPKVAMITEPQLDKHGDIIVDQDGNAVMQTVEKPILEPKVDSFGEPIMDEKGEPIMIPVMEDILDENGEPVMLPKQEMVMEDVIKPRMHNVLDENGQIKMVHRQEQDVDPETGEKIYEPLMETVNSPVMEEVEIEYNPNDLLNAQQQLDKILKSENYTEEELNNAKANLDKEQTRAELVYIKKEDGEEKIFIKENRPKINENGEPIFVQSKKPVLDEHGKIVPDLTRPKMHNAKKYSGFYQRSTVFTYRSKDAEKVQDLIARATTCVEKKAANREAWGHKPVKQHLYKRQSLREQLYMNVQKVKITAQSHAKIRKKVQPDGR